MLCVVFEVCIITMCGFHGVRSVSCVLYDVFRACCVQWTMCVRHVCMRCAVYGVCTCTTCVVRAVYGLTYEQHVDPGGRVSERSQGFLRHVVRVVPGPLLRGVPNCRGCRVGLEGARGRGGPARGRGGQEPGRAGGPPRGCLRHPGTLVLPSLRCPFALRRCRVGCHGALHGNHAA